MGKSDDKVCNIRKHRCYYIHYMNMLEQRIMDLEKGMLILAKEKGVAVPLLSARIFEGLR